MNKKFPQLIKQIYDAVEELEEMTNNSDYVNGKRRFTPDGHMVGSMGEVLAMHHYGIELYVASTKTHDGVIVKDGRNVQVQIKATQGSSVAVSRVPDHLLVLKISKDGKAEEIYNGPGGFVDALMKSKPEAERPKNGQYYIGFKKLREMMEDVAEKDRIKRINP